MNDREWFRVSLKHLLPCYRGIGKRSDRFVSFLRARGASEAFLRMFERYSFSEQIELDNGIVFAENEIILRNEFVEGEYLVLGADDEYSPLVVSLETSEVGTVGDSADVHRIDAISVSSSHALLPDFLAAHAIGVHGETSLRCASSHFNVDAVAIMKLYSRHAGISVSRTSSKFRQWLESVGIGKSFPFYVVSPKTPLFAGECMVGSEREIMEANFEERRRANPRFVCIGTCPDGCLVVLDTSTPGPSVGYVAIMEIGDEPGWERHYVCVSSSFGDFLHDSNFLNILPCDYYQALEFGYGRIRAESCHCMATGGMQSSLFGIVDDLPEMCNVSQNVSHGYAERRLDSGECYRVFSGNKSLFACEAEIARLLPSVSKDIWLASSAGFGEIDYQVSCLVDEADFMSFAKSLCVAGVMPSGKFSTSYHMQPVCWLFQNERERIAVGGQFHGYDGDNRFLSFVVSLGRVGRHAWYCYDTRLQSLSCCIGR